MARSKGAQLLTSAVAFDYVMDKLSKADLAECVLAFIALNQGACDEPPNLRQVCAHLDATLSARGSRTLSSHLAASKRKAPKLIEQWQRRVESGGNDHLKAEIARQLFILDS